MAIMDTLNEDLHTSHVPDDLKDVIFNLFTLCKLLTARTLSILFRFFAHCSGSFSDSILSSYIFCILYFATAYLLNITFTVPMEISPVSLSASGLSQLQCRLVFKQKLIYFHNDRHFHIIFLSQRFGCLCGINALHNHLHFIHSLLHGVTLSHQIAGASVSAVHTGTGNNQITNSGKAGKSLNLAPILTPSRAISAIPLVIKAAFVLSPYPKPSAVPAARAITFLKGTAKLYPQHIRCRIHPENRAHKKGPGDIQQSLFLRALTTHVVGSPRLTSSAWLGPESTQTSA